MSIHVYVCELSHTSYKIIYKFETQNIKDRTNVEPFLHDLFNVFKTLEDSRLFTSRLCSIFTTFNYVVKKNTAQIQS